MVDSTARFLPRLFDLSLTAHGRLFGDAIWPWDVLPGLDVYLESLLALDDAAATENRPVPAGVYLDGAVWIGPGCVVEPGASIQGPVHIGAGCRIESGAYIRGPAWIGEGCEIRQGAYLRGVVLAASGCVLGHASEFKRCVLLEHAQAPHFNYVGDSILGTGAHIGAGVILSNVRLDKARVRVGLLANPEAAPGDNPATSLDPSFAGRLSVSSGGTPLLDSGLEKLGALIGDYCEVGCNTVLNPGTVLGWRCVVPTLSRVKGTWTEGSSLATSFV